MLNNTIVDPENWIFRILQETTTSGEHEFLPCGDNLVQNNLVYYPMPNAALPRYKREKALYDDSRVAINEIGQTAEGRPVVVHAIRRRDYLSTQRSTNSETRSK